jgi:hypothetical protein
MRPFQSAYIGDDTSFQEASANSSSSKRKFIDGLRDCPNSVISIKTVSQTPKGRI